MLPEGKAEAVKELQAAGRVVAMAGNGVNDRQAAVDRVDLDKNEVRLADGTRPATAS